MCLRTQQSGFSEKHLYAFCVYSELNKKKFLTFLLYGKEGKIRLKTVLSYSLESLKPENEKSRVLFSYPEQFSWKSGNFYLKNSSNTSYFREKNGTHIPLSPG